MDGRVSRRATLAVAGAAGVPLLAACGDDGGTPSSTASESTTPSATSTPTTSPERSRKPSRSAEPADGLVATADVPVGGGIVLADEGVVVTQPSRGVFRGFSSTCTHQGCAVGSVGGGTINCPCHGSQFAIADGSVAAGPAASPLPAVAVRVQGGQVVRGD